VFKLNVVHKTYGFGSVKQEVLKSLSNPEQFRIYAVIDETFFMTAFNAVKKPKVDPEVLSVRNSSEGAVEASKSLMKVESTPSGSDWTNINTNYGVKWNYVRVQWISKPTDSFSSSGIEDTFADLEEAYRITSMIDTESCAKEWKARFGGLSSIASLYGKKSKKFCKGTLSALTEAKASERVLGMGLPADKLAAYTFSAQCASNVLAEMSAITSTDDYIGKTPSDVKKEHRNLLRKFMKKNFSIDVLILTLNISDLPVTSHRKLLVDFQIAPTAEKKRKLTVILDDWKTSLLNEWQTDAENFDFSKSTGKF
jgi:hypothetical protein